MKDIYFTISDEGVGIAPNDLINLLSAQKPALLPASEELALHYVKE